MTSNVRKPRLNAVKQRRKPRVFLNVCIRSPPKTAIDQPLRGVSETHCQALSSRFIETTVFRKCHRSSRHEKSKPGLHLANPDNRQNRYNPLDIYETNLG